VDIYATSICSLFSIQHSLEGIRTHTSMQQPEPTNNKQLQTIESTIVSMKILCIWAIDENRGGSKQKEGRVSYVGRKGHPFCKCRRRSGGYGFESDMCFEADGQKI